jgi:hypothetical protein
MNGVIECLVDISISEQRVLTSWVVDYVGESLQTIYNKLWSANGFVVGRHI